MSETTLDVLVFSDDSTTRQQIISSVGERVGVNGPRLTWHEAATAFGVGELVDAHDFALLVLDGEATKEGGMSIAKELETTHESLPPIVILTARPQDEWLATWAGAVRTIPAPFDPIVVEEVIADVLKGARR